MSLVTMRVNRRCHKLYYYEEDEDGRGDDTEKIVPGYEEE